MMSLTTRIHALLFVAGQEGISIAQMAQALAEDELVIEQSLDDLKILLFNDESSPVQLNQFGNYYQLVTKALFQPDVESFAKAPFQQTLSKAAIDTLAIIAYKQPVTRMTVDDIRGVSSSSMISMLVKRDLIKEVGRLKAPGRPLLYGVTDYFMDYFGLEHLTDLPELSPIHLELSQTEEQLFEENNWQIEWFEDE